MSPLSVIGHQQNTFSRTNEVTGGRKLGSGEETFFRPLSHDHAAAISSQTNSFEKYLQDQEAGRRWVLVAQAGAEVAGYVTLLWAADDPVLRDQAVPEISDLSVFPEFRRRGIGSALLDAAEAEAATRSHVV